MLMLIADIIVILGCGYIGMSFAYRINSRISQLEEFEKMFSLLVFDIGYMAIPINEAIIRVQSSVSGVVRSVLEQTMEFISMYNDIPFSDAWCRAVKMENRDLFLTKEELNTLFDFSRNVGKGDCEQAVNSIKVTIAKIKLAKENAIAEKNKNSKLYKGAGFLFGILIVLILL